MGSPNFDHVGPLQNETEARRGGVTYLLTTNEDGSPHAVTVEATWEKGRLRCDVGSGAQANVDRQPLVSFLWPAASAADYTLLVDGDAVVLMDGSLSARPVRGVLHRAGTATNEGSTCGSDCVQLFPE